MVGHRTLVLLILITVVVSLSGCVARFREAPVQPPASWPITTALVQKSISLRISSELFMENVDRGEEEYRSYGLSDDTRDKWKYLVTPIIAKAYESSGLFLDVDESHARDTDLTAEIHILRRDKTSRLGFFVTLFIAFLIPSVTAQEIKITTTFKNRKLQTLETFERAESGNEWIQLFLMFYFPFQITNGSSENDTIYDLTRSILSQAYGEGLFSNGS